MSINTRLAKAESKLMINKSMTVEVTFCNEGETSEQAVDRLGIDDAENVHRIFVSFDD